MVDFPLGLRLSWLLSLILEPLGSCPLPLHLPRMQEIKMFRICLSHAKELPSQEAKHGVLSADLGSA